LMNPVEKGSEFGHRPHFLIERLMIRSYHSADRGCAA
jgi:hypothetical protein